MKYATDVRLSKLIGLFRWNILCATGSFIIPILVATHKFGFKFGSFSTPLFFYGDESFGASWVFSLLHAHSLTNHTFGWPLGQDFNFAFVSQDTAPHVFAAIIAAIKGNPYFGMNVYMLLTFGLVGLSFYLSARVLGAKNPESFLLALSVSLLPQHFSSATQALTVISYYLVPPIIAVSTMQIARRHSRVKFLQRRNYWIAWLVFCFLSGFLYSYYSVGTIIILGSLACAISIFDGSTLAIRSILANLVAVGGGFLVASIPSLANVHHTYGGINYFSQRSFQAAYANSGSLVQSISPVYGTTTYRVLDFFHKGWNVTFGQLKDQVNGYGIFQEGWNASISLALIILVAAQVYFVGKKVRSFSPKQKINENTEYFTKEFYVLLTLSLMTLLWMWAGGLGTFFAMFISQTLRGYARFSVYAVIALAFAAALSIGFLRETKIRKQVGVKMVTALMLLVVVFDGFSVTVYSQPATIASDVASIQKMVTSIPKNCNVLQFPVTHFPYESPGWPAYSLMTPGLVGNRADIHWSSGAVGGSKDWLFISKYRTFQNVPSKDVFAFAKADGFCAILIDSAVWKTFHDFAPNSSYPRVPAVTLQDFQNVVGMGQEIKTQNDSYYLYILK